MHVLAWVAVGLPVILLMLVGLGLVTQGWTDWSEVYTVLVAVIMATSIIWGLRYLLRHQSIPLVEQRSFWGPSNTPGVKGPGENRPSSLPSSQVYVYIC